MHKCTCMHDRCWLCICLAVLTTLPLSRPQLWPAAAAAILALQGLHAVQAPSQALTAACLYLALPDRTPLAMQASACQHSKWRRAGTARSSGPTRSAAHAVAPDVYSPAHAVHSTQHCMSCQMHFPA